MSPWRELARWVHRARPPQRTVAAALVAGSAAALTGVALFVGAPYLLVYSASHTKLVAGGTLALLLIVIELLAFLRSPLRFAERLSAHDLGLRSVTQWRRWLVHTVGSWPYRRWRAASSGDLLERAMNDTDTLQDIWLRCLVPLISSTLALFVADLFVGFMHAARFSGPQVALSLLATQLVVLAAYGAQLPRLVRVERLVRQARATRTARRVELLFAAPEIELLGRRDYLSDRLTAYNAHVATLERRRTQRWRLARLVAVVAPVVSLLLVALAAGGTSHLAGRSGIVVILIALGVVELALAAHQALRVAVAVTTAAERLDELAHHVPTRSHGWPEHQMIDVEALRWRHGDVDVLRDVTFTVAPGRRVAITGANGSGKSTLLRALARLDEVPLGTITVGEVDLCDIDELALRRHLGYVSAEPGLLDGNADAVVRAGRASADASAGALEQLEITPNALGRLEHLSRGEAQRVALVRGLLDEPSVVVLDEPTSGLGAHERALVINRLSQLSASVIVATHDEQLVAWCDEHYELFEGVLRRLNR